jgi:CO/xanthine dehydrogenase FAD-binding subunit
VNKKNICYSSYCGDMAPVLLIVNAKLVLQSKEDSREISTQSLFSGNGKNPLDKKREEILSEIVIPLEALDGFSIYIKFAHRESIDFPIVGTAFWASMERKEYRVSFTGVDRKPLRAQNIENVLKGNDLSEEIMEEVADLASQSATPVKSSIYAPSYTRRIMRLLLQSTMREAMRRSKR